MGPASFLALLASTALLFAALAWLVLERLRYLRLVEDLPTARVRSAAQGYVELEGQAAPFRGRPLASPLRGRPCVWWSYRVEDFGSDGTDHPVGALLALLRLLRIPNTGRHVESGRSREPFLIRDASAACVVDPAEAHVIEARTERWRDGSRHYVESIIPAGAPLYALGLFRTPRDYAQQLEAREVGALVSAWKMDRLELAARFDANRDGDLDDAEWTTAWQAAAAEIRQRRAQDPYPDLHVLCSSKDGRPFVLSALTQRRLAGRFWFQTVTSLLVLLTTLVVLLWSLGIRGVI